jgi:gliding motility-associated-like protein
MLLILKPLRSKFVYPFMNASRMQGAACAGQRLLHFASSIFLQIVYSLIVLISFLVGAAYTCTAQVSSISPGDSTALMNMSPRPISISLRQVKDPEMVRVANSMTLSGATFKMTARRNTDEVNSQSPALTMNSASANSTSLSATGNTTGCPNVAGQFALKNDTISLYARSTLVLRDNNLLVTGEVLIFKPTRSYYYGLIMKMDAAGKVIWSNMYDSLGSDKYNHIFYSKAIELSDGSIIATGLTGNSSSKNDIVFTKIDKAGNTIWHRFYKSRLWTNDQTVASGYFNVKQMVQDPASGDLFVAADYWLKGRGMMRINQNNGDVVWAKSYQTVNGVFDNGYGMQITNNEIVFFGQQRETYSYLGVYRIKTSTGDVVARKDFTQVMGQFNISPLASGQVIRLNNGNLAMTGHGGINANDGTRLPQGFVLEFDNTLNYVSGYSINSSITQNGANTRVTLNPDGSGILAALDNNSPGYIDNYYVQFRNGQILKQRRKRHQSDILYFDAAPVRLSDGSDVVAKLLADKVSGIMRTAFVKMFPTDPESECLGVNDGSSEIASYQLTESPASLFTVENDVVEASSGRTFTKFNIPILTEVECRLISPCDSTKISVSDTVLCINKTLLVRVHKKAGCTMTVPLRFDSSAVSNITRPDDSTYIISFKSAWSGYMSAYMDECSPAADSIRISVTDASTGALQLGADTSVCAGQTVKLDAGANFQEYLWQDGSTDPTLIISSSGTYHVQAQDACGNLVRDTIKIGMLKLPDVNLDKTNEICSGQTRMLDAGNHASYSWQNGSNASTFMVNAVGTYHVTVSDHNGCVNSDTVVISQLLTAPAKFLKSDTTVCSYSSITLKADNTFKEYYWNNGATIPGIEVSRAGIYWLEVKDVNGCKGRDTIVVKGQECRDGLHLPNAFTPNRDGKNDQFKAILFGDVETFELTIYNRWGGQIFRSTDRYKGWDGTLGARPSDSGLYVWTCRYKLRGQVEVTTHGQVVLIR